MTSGKKTPVSVGMISLGCAKNLVDAEIMLGSLIQSGFRITNEAASADVLIVNTCSFIDAAQEESIDAILESAQARQRDHPGQALIVSGCLPQRFRDDLPKLLPEVDAFMGIDQVAQVSDIVAQALARRREKLGGGAAEAPARTEVARRLAQLEKEPPPVHVHLRPSYIPDFATPRFRLTPRHFAYVKIAEGCNHPCSFCIIPRMRGSHRSRPQGDIVREARRLIAEGVKELNLISQDSTYYGLDLRAGQSRAISSPEKFTAAAHALPADAATLGTLLRELNDLRGNFWIRLLYTHPAHWTDELIGAIAQCPKVARYVDMPLQHIHPNMLERMRRETSRQYIVDLIARMRAGIPGLALRTTFIVGFPGETEEYFQALLEFIRATRFERLGVFTYSQQAGTRGENGGSHCGRGQETPPATGHGGAIKDRPANFRRARRQRGHGPGRTRGGGAGFGNGSGAFVGARLDPFRLPFAVHPRRRAVLGGAQRGRRAGHRWPRLSARRGGGGRVREGENYRAH
jgi:ribosomal protein S12 methylthiotransferase